MSLLLTIDAGNTNIVLGLFRDDKLVHHWRIHTDRKKLLDEYTDQIASFLAKEGVKKGDITEVAISSVVPSMARLLDGIAVEYFGVTPFKVSHKNRMNIKLAIENPAELGADLIAAAVAGVEKYGTPLIIIDMGTATTVTAINRDKELAGVAIMPGLAISCEALYRFAPHLPRIPLEMPPSVIGKNTVESMQAGIFIGYGHMMEGIIGDMKQILGEDAKVISTGGLSSLFNKGSLKSKPDFDDEDLVIEGIRLLSRMQQK
ncbi:MAG: type III pantothenate kinase [Firmicutes bacterium]|nr:type III pantothenate kinase [Bacillota bacterium]